MSYSLDFRKHVFKIKEREALSFAATSVRFGISVRTLFRWKNRLEPKTTRNKAATKIDMAALEKHVEDYPDAYQYERALGIGSKPQLCSLCFETPESKPFFILNPMKN